MTNDEASRASRHPIPTEIPSLVIASFVLHPSQRSARLLPRLCENSELDEAGVENDHRNTLGKNKNVLYAILERRDFRRWSFHTVWGGRGGASHVLATGQTSRAISVPQGRATIAQCFSTGLAEKCGESRRGRQKFRPPVLLSPAGLAPLSVANPALKCWAIVARPCGTDAETQDPVQENGMRPGGGHIFFPRSAFRAPRSTSPPPYRRRLRFRHSSFVIRHSSRFPLAPGFHATHLRRPYEPAQRNPADGKDREPV